MTSTSKSNAPSASSFKSLNLTSLPKLLLLEVVRLLDAQSRKQLRLTNKLLRHTADELVTCIPYGTAPECCNPVQLESVAKRWPSIKIIELFFAETLDETIDDEVDEEITDAIECLLRTKWTAIEEIKFPEATFNSRVPAYTNISGAQALAACTVSWGRLRKLKMQGAVMPEGLDVLATHGAFPS